MHPRDEDPTSRELGWNHQVELPRPSAGWSAEKSARMLKPRESWQLIKSPRQTRLSLKFLCSDVCMIIYTPYVHTRIIHGQYLFLCRLDWRIHIAPFLPMAWAQALPPSRGKRPWQVGFRRELGNLKKLIIVVLGVLWRVTVDEEGICPHFLNPKFCGFSVSQRIQLARWMNEEDPEEERDQWYLPLILITYSHTA